MKRNQILILVAVVLLGTASYTWWHNTQPPALPSLGPEIQERFQGAGRILASESAKVLPPHTTVIICKQPGKVFIPVNELIGLTAGLKDAGMTVEDGGTMTFAWEGGQPVYYLTPDQYAAIQRHTPPVSGIITFGGMPSPDTAKTILASETHPKVIVIDEELRRVAPLLDSGAVNWAAVQRSGPVTLPRPEPKTPQEQFDASFVIVRGKAQ